MTEDAKKHATEIIPSVAGTISALASADARFVYFEGAPFLRTRGRRGGRLCSSHRGKWRSRPIALSLPITSLSRISLEAPRPCALCVRHWMEYC